MMLLHTARCAAGSRGVNEAGQIGALDARCTLQHRRHMRRAVFHLIRPIKHADITLLRGTHIFHHNEEFDMRTQRCGHDRPGQFGRRDDHGTRAAVIQDMLVVALSVGDVCRHRHAAGGHDAMIGNQPFRPVFRNKNDPIPVIEAESTQVVRKCRDLITHLSPALADPGAISLVPKERRITAFVHAGVEQRNQVRKAVNLFWLGHVSLCVFPGRNVCARVSTPDHCETIWELRYSTATAPTLRGSAAPVQPLPSSSRSAAFSFEPSSALRTVRPKRASCGAIAIPSSVFSRRLPSPAM